MKEIKFFQRFESKYFILFKKKKKVSIFFQSRGTNVSLVIFPIEATNTINNLCMHLFKLGTKNAEAKIIQRLLININANLTPTTFFQ